MSGHGTPTFRPRSISPDGNRDPPLAPPPPGRGVQEFPGPDRQNVNPPGSRFTWSRQISRRHKSPSSGLGCPPPPPGSAWHFNSTHWPTRSVLYQTRFRAVVRLSCRSDDPAAACTERAGHRADIRSLIITVTIIPVSFNGAKTADEYLDSWPTVVKRGSRRRLSQPAIGRDQHCGKVSPRDSYIDFAQLKLFQGQ